LIINQANAGLALELEAGGPSEEQIQRRVAEAGFDVSVAHVPLGAGGERRRLF